MAEPFILCDGLVKIYKIAGLEQVALRELNLSVQAGELMAIVGASGSGKTTLMNILGGLDRPSAGRVLVGGKDLLRMSDRDLNRYRREQVGFVWQQSTRNLIPYLNAIDNVMLPMTVAGKTRRSRQRAAELLSLVGLGNRMHHRLSELSGGEQQRVAIAVGLANNPPLLLADEPTGEVDTATAALIYDTFRTLTREMGVTTIIVSHDPGVARQVDRVVAIRDGMLASETVRQPIVRTPEWLAENGHDAGGEHHTFEELVVLDKAGRVHIPPEYLEQVQIRGRARLEVTDAGILIRPVEEVAAQTQITTAAGSEPPKRGGLRALFGRRTGKQA
ncbi:MAG TPA: ABC transporter ATP-binding protein [Chloroflexi bacterium]|nr:ABC transporter ATP-binding protein [Chloroflexota bacterium]